MLVFQQTTEPSFPENLLIAINKNGVNLIDPRTKVCSNLMACLSVFVILETPFLRSFYGLPWINGNGSANSVGYKWTLIWLFFYKTGNPVGRIENLGSVGGLVVISHASHLCDPGSIMASAHMWAELQSISTWLRGFFSRYSGFPPSTKSTPRQLDLAGLAVLRDHTWIVWRQPWAPSHAIGPIQLSRLTLKSPCREWSTKAHLHLHLHLQNQ